MRILLSSLFAITLFACTSTQRAETPPVTREVKLDASNIAEAQAAGYKVVDQNGETLLCRKELQTGSHVRYRTSCLTAQEWRQLAESARASVQDMARRVPPPRGH